MSYKTLCVCVVCTLVSSSLIGSVIGKEITRPSLMAPARLGNVRVFHKEDNPQEDYPQNNSFVVERNGEKRDIQPCFISSNIRNISTELLGQFLVADNYLKLHELNSENGSVDYRLEACSRLNGGGPWLGALTFIGGALATVATTVGAIVVTTPAGPVAMAAAGGTAAYGGMALTAKATIVATAAPTP